MLRPYGIRVFLTARFAAPIEIGGLRTADPADPAVRQWWRAKVAEIYRSIPDFGGFLVKANSEGQPGPQDYGRSHADGANMLADALAPFGGVVMWRTFVYSNESPDDRAKQAYSEFVPLDGKFRDNVMVQVKNGPIDFQPREPFHPLFGAMPRTPLMLEVQITKEYLGFATHLAYLGTMYEEVLRADTYARGPGSTVAKVIDGSLHGYRRTGIAGVANIGTDRNWSGSHFDQANWYAFGRLAWNPDAVCRGHCERVGAHDVRQRCDARGASRRHDDEVASGGRRLHDAARTASPDGGGSSLRPAAVVRRRAASGLDARVLSSRRRTRHRFRSQRERQQRRRAVRRTGGCAIRRSEDACPEDYLLWFHHVPWDYRTQSGRTLWDELVHRYTPWRGCGARDAQDLGRARAAGGSRAP